VKFFILSLVLVSQTLFAKQTDKDLAFPECKDRNGNVVNGSIAQLRNVMNNPRDSRAQVYTTGTITVINKEDNTGLPHQKFDLKVDSDITLSIVSNLDFGRIPLTVGKKISICGEFRRIGKGMVHWTHFDPHGGHPNGFSILDGVLYGEHETR
jgi:predicted small secreted protein